MVVSEILGTLTTSESMCKYLSLYRPHIRTFGAERRVYMVPQQTIQSMAVHAFDCTQMGAALPPLLRSAVCYGTARNRLVPTNEGGLNLLLHLYPSREVTGSRMHFHTETYEYMLPERPNDRAGACAFAVDASCDKLTSVSLADVDDSRELAIGLMEWEVCHRLDHAAGTCRFVSSPHPQSCACRYARMHPSLRRS